MKILIFVPSFTLDKAGHVPVFFQNRVVSYLKAGHEVEVITHEYKTDGNKIIKNLKISIVDKNLIYEELRKRFNSADLFLIHFINYRIIKFLIRYNVRTTIFFHGVEAISSKRYSFDWLIMPRFYFKKFIYNIIHFYFLKTLIREKKNIKLVFVSDWMRNAMENDLNIDFSKSQFSIIPNSVSDKFLNSSVNHQLDETGKLNILVLKNFDSYKYAGDLTLKYILDLSKTQNFKKFNFTILGKGFILNKYKKKLSKFDNVEIKNRFFINEELIEIYKKHHIFLYLTRLDAQSVSISEALSIGLTVISSKVAAIPEFITHGENGFLINNNFKEFQKCLMNIYENKEILKKISENAKKLSQQLFSTDLNSKKEIEFASSKINCSKCLVDSSISEVYFDDQKVCSYCNKFIPYIENLKSEIRKSDKFNTVLKYIKTKSKNNKYNCLIGVSGGVDSSYVVHLAYKNGLSPLLVHFDNGWNSELANTNINNLINKTGFDLKTVVVNWEEFRDIQISFLKAGVIDIELVTDHAIFANLLDVAAQYKIKNILSGTNIMTEHAMPLDWIWRKTDLRNIKDIHKKEGTGKIKSYPRMNFIKWYLNLYVFKKYNIFEPLNYINYSKKKALEILDKEYDWRDYDEKHYESIFTKFYQSYILPNKFNIDKKIVHYSSLIRNKEISKEEALIRVQSTNNDNFEIEKDKKYLAKKLDLSLEQFDKLISNDNVRSHFDYRNSEFSFQLMKKIFYFIK